MTVINQHQALYLLTMKDVIAENAAALHQVREIKSFVENAKKQLEQREQEMADQAVEEALTLLKPMYRDFALDAVKRAIRLAKDCQAKEIDIETINPESVVEELFTDLENANKANNQDQ